MDVTALIIEIAESGREATDAEIQQIRAHVAAAGFEPGGMTRAGGRIVGLSWEGQVIRSNMWIENSVAHYLRHAVVQAEWPISTSFDAYLTSLRQTVRDEDGGIAIEKRHNRWHVTFAAPAGDAAGPRSHGWILVAYQVEYGYWSTGFQPQLGLRHFKLNEAEGERWLRTIPDQTKSITS